MNSPNKTIAITISSLSGGGAEKMAVNIANGLSNKGNAVDLLVGRSHGPNKDNLISTVKLINLEAQRVRNSLKPLMRYLKTTHPDVLISTMPDQNMVTAFAHLLSKHKSRLVLREASTPSVRKSTWFTKNLLKLSYKYADSIVAVSEGAKQDIVSFFNIHPDKITVIYNPVLPEKLVPDKYLRKNKPTVRIVSAGRLVKEKGFDDIIKAIGFLKDKENIELIIYGIGPEHNYLKNLAQEFKVNLNLPGYSKNLVDDFKKDDLYVSASRREGFPNTIVEALSVGLPVVSYDCPSGPKEILLEGKYGILVKLEDVHALSDAILETVKEIHKGTDFSKNIHRANDFTFDKIIPQYVSLVNNLCLK